MLVYISLFSFLGAFSSIGYQVVASLLISDLIKNESIGFHITIGVFLFGLSLGAMWHNFEKIEDRYQILKQFLYFETLLCVCGLLSVPFIYGVYSLTSMIELSNQSQILIFMALTLPLVFIIGLISGVEIPLIIALSSKERIGLLLGINYIGGLLSSMLIPFFLASSFNFYQLLAPFVIANCLLFFVIAMVLTSRKHLLISASAALVVLLSTNILVKKSNYLEQMFLKIHYMGVKLDRLSIEGLRDVVEIVKSSKDIIHLRSAYQTIDFIDERNGLNALTAPSFSLYLNRDPQFSKDTWLGYHESMVAGAFNLNRNNNMENILIIGGGDGLLLKVLLEHYGDNIKNIDLVEIDPAMVYHSTEYLPMVELNKRSLTNEKVNIHYEDAFKFVRKSKKQYEGIFIDLPYPNSFDLLRLYSLEFYTSVRKAIKEDGFMIMDAPVWWPMNGNAVQRPMPQDVLFSTLGGAGFGSIFVYGPIEPFLFLKERKYDLSFDYHSLPSWISDRAFMNLTEMPVITENVLVEKKYINSVFHPIKFRF